MSPHVPRNTCKEILQGGGGEREWLNGCTFVANDVRRIVKVAVNLFVQTLGCRHYQIKHYFENLEVCNQLSDFLIWLIMFFSITRRRRKLYRSSRNFYRFDMYQLLGYTLTVIRNWQLLKSTNRCPLTEQEVRTTTNMIVANWNVASYIVHLVTF